MSFYLFIKGCPSLFFKRDFFLQFRGIFAIAVMVQTKKKEKFRVLYIGHIRLPTVLKILVIVNLILRRFCGASSSLEMLSKRNETQERAIEIICVL